MLAGRGQRLQAVVNADNLEALIFQVGSDDILDADFIFNHKNHLACCHFYADPSIVTWPPCLWSKLYYCVDEQSNVAFGYLFQAGPGVL